MIKSKDISIVVQGPIYETTDETINNLREFFPDAEIIVSTWEGSDYKNDKADIITESKDPGGHPLWDEPVILNACNRQIVSTVAGLNKATRKYAMKIRSDMYFKHTNFLRHWGKYNKRCDKYKILDDRILISTSFAPNPRRGEAKPFHPSDWFFFGLTSDLIKVFDSPLCPEPETSRYFETHKRPRVRYDFWYPAYCQYSAEQYIWVAFCKRFIPDLNFEHCFDIEKGNIDKSELVFANNTVMLNSIDIGYDSYKRINHHDTCDLAFMYSHHEWLKLYQKYCDKFAFIPLVDREKIRRVMLAFKYKRQIKFNIRALFNYIPKKTVEWE